MSALGKLCSKLTNIFRPARSSRTDSGPTFDPDEKWSNLYREREKNHLYKWVGARSGGELISIYEKEGEEGVLSFAVEKLEPMMYDGGQKTQTIKYADYVKWKKTVNIQLGLSEDESLNAENIKFQEHEAQWRLNKRGVDGETIIHLLLNREEPACCEIARILINKYPGLAKDIYLGTEMFGQSALHLAIVQDDYDTVQLLLENGASVNARASGDFFLPEEYKTNNNTKTLINYQGYAYYGEYPLAFAACFGNKDIYDLLIQYGADPDLQDMFGNSILHMCVINYSTSMYGYAVRHWHKPAHPNFVNNAGYTPLTLASKLGRRQIFEEMLELMKVEFWRFSDMTCSAYPLTTLDTIRPDGSTNYDSALMTVINGNTSEHLDMIGSEVIQRLLADKWKAFAARKLFERLALLVVHLVCLCIIVYTRPVDNDELTQFKNVQDWFRIIFEVFTIISCLYFIVFQQLGEIKTQGLYGYIRNLKTAPSKIIFIIANICLLLCVPCRFLNMGVQINFPEIEEALLVFALPGSWIFLLFFARSAKLTGPFVQMIYSMIAGDMIRFAIISAIFLISFSQVFYFVGKDIAAKMLLSEDNSAYCHSDDPSSGFTYSTFLETFITLFRASMGGYDYEQFKCANYEPLTKVLFVAYMFVMPIMMINILIAMMGNTYVTIITQAEKAWRQQYAQIVMVLERSVNKQKLAACQLEYSIKLNDANQETRGLMVIKQTNKTRARQRKQAIINWKNLGRKVIHTIERLGVEHAKHFLHAHERIYDETAPSVMRKTPSAMPPKISARTGSPMIDVNDAFERRLDDAVLLVEASKRANSRAVSRVNPSDTHLHPPAAQIPPLPHPNSVHSETPMPLSVDAFEFAAPPPAYNSVANGSAPTGVLPHPPQPINVYASQNSAVSLSNVRSRVIRGVEMVPAHDVPNMPGLPDTPPVQQPPMNPYTTPPPRAISPRIRSDMFRKKDSKETSPVQTADNLYKDKN